MKLTNYQAEIIKKLYDGYKLSALITRNCIHEAIGLETYTISKSIHGTTYKTTVPITTIRSLHEKGLIEKTEKGCYIIINLKESPD